MSSCCKRKLRKNKVGFEKLCEVLHLSAQATSQIALSFVEDSKVQKIGITEPTEQHFCNQYRPA